MGSGKQRYAKAFVAAGIDIFFDKELLASCWQPHLVFLLNSDCFVICMLPAMWHISYTRLAKERKIHPCSHFKNSAAVCRTSCVVWWDCRADAVSGGRLMVTERQLRRVPVS